MPKPMTVIRYRPEQTNRLYRKKRHIKILLAVFGGLIGLSLAISSFVYMIKDIQNLTDPGTDVVVNKEDENPYSERDTFNILMVGVSYENALEYISVVSFSPCDKSVRIATLSDQTRIEGIAGGKALSEVYALSGIKGITSAAEEITQVGMYGTVTLDFAGTTNYFDVFGGSKVYLDQDISYITSDSIMGIIAAKGTRTFSGRELVRLFSYRGWKNGEYDRTFFVSKALAAVADNNISGGTAAKYTGYYSSVVNKVTTDISAAEFENIKKYIYYLSRCNARGEGLSSIYKVVAPTAEDGSSPEGFAVTDAALMNLRAFFAR